MKKLTNLLKWKIKKYITDSRDNSGADVPNIVKDAWE